MKTVNKICQFLAIASFLAAVVFFFTDFATIVPNVPRSKLSFSFSGAQLGFGADTATFAMNKSSKLLFCFLVSALAFICSAFTLRKKSKASKFAAPAFGLVSAIFMLVVSLSHPAKFVDADTIRDFSLNQQVKISYEVFVYVVTALLFVGVIAGIAHLLINDKIECEKDKNKLTIPRKVIRFIRDYKSEIKKIVWPSARDVVKNTFIVLVMCAIVGVFIWAVDKGLAELLRLIVGK